MTARPSAAADRLTDKRAAALAGALLLFAAAMLAADPFTDPSGHLLLGVTAWLVLALALGTQPRDVRVQVAVLVVIATALECVGSLLWRAYVYRLGDLPLFVPAGHGLLYLAALRISSLQLLERHRRMVIVGVTAAATATMVAGLTLREVPDLLGFVTWAIYLRFIVRGRFPLLYAVSFVLTMALEYYGTGLGVWRWAPVLPGLYLPAANPPSGVGAGYCAMDALTRRVIARITRALRARDLAAGDVRRDLAAGDVASGSAALGSLGRPVSTE